MSMFALIYGVLFSLHFLPYECYGKIISPPDRTEVAILPGSSMNITWTYDDNPSTVTSRSWYFTSYSGLVKRELIAQISRFGIGVRKDILPGVDLIEPATLSLSNVNESYDGTYEFSLVVSTQITAAISHVIVYIAKNPNVIFSCFRRNELNEGDNFTCVCRGEGGRPPANVTWSKDGKQIGGIGKENQTLTLSNVDEKASGTYKCKAQSYPSDEYIDERSLVVKVNSKPYDTNITSTPGPIIEVGGLVVITCKVHGFPIPSYNITHNVTKIVSINKTHTIEKVKWSDAGTYKCIAKNKFGSDSDSTNLTVAEVRPTTLPPTITTTTKGNQTAEVQPATHPPTIPITPTTTKDNQTVFFFEGLRWRNIFRQFLLWIHDTHVKRVCQCSAESCGFSPGSPVSSYRECSQDNCKTSSKDVSTETEWYIVVVILVSGIIIGILLSYIVWCSRRRWFRNRKPERTPEPQPTEVDTTYQELDLTKMNTEDNYQSLRVHAVSNDAANDDDSTYTELNKTRDVENNYQSLT